MDGEVKRVIDGETPEGGIFMNLALMMKVNNYAHYNGLEKCFACNRYVKPDTECTKPEEFKYAFNVESASHEILRKPADK